MKCMPGERPPSVGEVQLYPQPSNKARPFQDSNGFGGRPRRAGGGLLVGQPGTGNLATLSYSLEWGVCRRAWKRGKDKKEAGPLVIEKWSEKASSGS